MANEYYVIQETTLQEITDAVKNRTNDTSIKFSDMPEKIASMPMDTSDVEAFIDGTIVAVSNENLELLPRDSFKDCPLLETVNFPKVKKTEASIFENCSSLTSLNLPLLTSFGASSFRNCINLETVNFPNVTTVGSYGFADCTSLTSVNLPLASNIETYMFEECSNLSNVNTPVAKNINSYSFKKCSNLNKLEFPMATAIKSYAFRDCFNLDKLILNSTSICSLENVNAFLSTPIDNNIGYIYVPTALIDRYKTATNWSNYANQFIQSDIAFIPKIKNKLMTINTTNSVSVDCFTADNNPVITVISNNETIVSVSNIQYSNEILTFNLNSLASEGTATITINLNATDGSYERTFDAKVFETIPQPNFTVETVDGASYGFVLNDEGYYEAEYTPNGNAAVCKVVFNTQGVYNLRLDCFNFKSGYDSKKFGILSTIDGTLDISCIEDTNNVFKSFKGLSKDGIQMVNYENIVDGEHFIYVKYFNQSGAIYTETPFKFKIHFDIA